MPDEREFLARMHAKREAEDAADLLIIRQAADRATMLLMELAPLLNLTIELPELLLPPTKPVKRA
jgi:hypothetical protein